MSFWYPFLTTSLAIHHSSKGIQFRRATTWWGPHTWPQPHHYGTDGLSIRQPPSPFQKGAANDLVAHDNPLERLNYLAALHWPRWATPVTGLPKIAVRWSLWPHHRLQLPTGVMATWKLLIVTAKQKYALSLWWKHNLSLWEQWTKSSLGTQAFLRSLPTFPPTYLISVPVVRAHIYSLQGYSLLTTHNELHTSIWLGLGLGIRFSTLWWLIKSIHAWMLLRSVALCRGHFQFTWIFGRRIGSGVILFGYHLQNMHAWCHSKYQSWSCDAKL